ncbi:MAG: heavy metal-responsive transcriptional regulator [Parvibaculaceae bacterium]
MRAYKIGEISKLVSLSMDTLRYYEKIKLLPPVTRNSSGMREYDDKDISRLRFIKRAQKMNFSLAEIGQLLTMRENPLKARTEVRTLTHQKLSDIEDQIKELTTLRNELQLLVNLCMGSDDSCPIIDGMDRE